MYLQTKMERRNKKIIIKNIKFGASKKKLIGELFFFLIKKIQSRYSGSGETVIYKIYLLWPNNKNIGRLLSK